MRDYHRLVMVASLLLTATACYPASWDGDGDPKPAPAVTRAGQGPCADTTYVRMKRAPVDSLSQREYELFRQRDAACLEFQTRSRSDAAQEAQVEEQRAARRSYEGWIIFGVFISAISALIVL